METNEDKWVKAEKRIMSALHLVFTALYGYAPLLIVPLLAYHYGNWWLLFGILFAYAGAAGQLSVLFAVVAIGFWIVNGFDIHQYITFFFFCNLWGCLMYHWVQAYDEERKMRTSDSEHDMVMADFNSTFVSIYASKFPTLSDEIEAGALQYLKDHPGTTLTKEIMDGLVKSIEMKEEGV